jgi:hypothetical protein
VQHKHLFANPGPMHKEHAKKEQKREHPRSVPRQQINAGVPGLLH